MLEELYCIFNPIIFCKIFKDIFIYFLIYCFDSFIKYFEKTKKQKMGLASEQSDSSVIFLLFFIFVDTFNLVLVISYLLICAYFIIDCIFTLFYIMSKYSEIISIYYNKF